MRKKLSLTTTYRPSGIRLMLIASRLDRNAVVNISEDCCRAASALRKLSAMRNCFSLVKTNRTTETTKEAVIAVQASVTCSCAILRAINKTSRGMQTGNTREIILTLAGEDGSCSVTASSGLHVEANTVTKRYGRHQTTSYHFARPTTVATLRR